MHLKSSRRRSLSIASIVLGTALSIGVYSCDYAHTPTATGLTPRQRIHRDASPYWPDEPAGFATVVDYAFNDSIPASNGAQIGTSRWSINFNSAGGVTQATNQTDAPVSPPNAGEWTFPAGFTGGSAGIMVYDDTVGSQEVFLELTFKASSPLEDPGHPRELAEVVGNSVNYSVDLEATGGGAHRIDVSRSAGTLVPNQTSSDATLATWHTLELYIKYSSTDSAADGIVRWWLDDTLQGESTTETMASDGGLYETRVEARWDGSFAKTVQDQVWYDQVHVSRATSASASWPNLPASYTEFRDEPFNVIPATGWTDDYASTGLMTIAQDATAPLSPPNVLQFSYPVGFVGSQAPDTYVTDWPVPRPTRVYAGFWWKCNASWQDNSDNINKIVFFQMENSAGGVILTSYGAYPNGPYYLRFYAELPSDSRSGNYGNFTNNKSSGLMTLGQWHRIEWQLEYGTPGTPTGIVRWWLDGALVGEYLDVTFPTTGNIEEFQLSPTWGGAADTKTQQDYFWFDHVFLASAP